MGTKIALWAYWLFKRQRLYLAHHAVYSNNAKIKDMINENFHQYFTFSEFDSPDQPGSGVLMDREFLNQLTIARIAADVPFRINSGYRTKEHNNRLIEMGFKASPNSSHMKGVAADIAVHDNYERFRVISGLIEAGFARIGIGNGFIHVDSDRSKARNVAWLY